MVTFSRSSSVPSELRAVADQVVFGVLNFVADMFEGLKVSSFYNIKEIFVKDLTIGLQGITELLSSQSRLLQLGAMKVLVEYSTFCQTREWVDTNKIDPRKLLCIKDDDNSIMARYLRHQLEKFECMIGFPYDKSSPAQKGSSSTASTVKGTEDGKPRSEVQEGIGSAVKASRRGRRRALALQQGVEQSVTQVGGTTDYGGSQTSLADDASDFGNVKRMEILTDFVLSERVYVSDLNKAIWLYFKPLYYLPRIKNLSCHTKMMDEFLKIFSVLGYIVNYSTAFLNVIETRFT